MMFEEMDQIREQYFKPMDVSHHKATSNQPFSCEKSPLSLLIEKFGINMNPFLKYIQYDIKVIMCYWIDSTRDLFPKNNPGTTKVLTYSIKINSIVEV